MNKKRNWAIAITLSATAGVFALQNVSAPSAVDATITFTPTEISPITFTPTYEGCFFVWATHDDLEVSEKISQAIQTLDPTAGASVQLYGEDCVYADGHSTFSTMETNFYVRLPVEDLSTEDKFGAWIKQVMDVIIAMPEDAIPGSKGFVEFILTGSDAKQIIFRVSIYDYKNLAPEITNIELFRMFYIPPP